MAHGDVYPMPHGDVYGARRCVCHAARRCVWRTAMYGARRCVWHSVSCHGKTKIMMPMAGWGSRFEAAGWKELGKGLSEPSILEIKDALLLGDCYGGLKRGAWG